MRKIAEWLSSKDRSIFFKKIISLWFPWKVESDLFFMMNRCIFATAFSLPSILLYSKLYVSSNPSAIPFACTYIFSVKRTSDCMPRYTPEQLVKRNASIWTDIQIILAPIQFLIFVAGVTITILYANGLFITDFYWVSVVILFKTLFFALLFITGMFFEKEIFDKWVYSKEFLWEDIGSTVAAAFHLLYFVLAFLGYPEDVLIWEAFLAYFTYVVNALQYLVRIILEKLNERKLRLDGRI